MTNLNEINSLTELLLSAIYVDTFENYNEDAGRTVTSVGDYEIGYNHDGKTLTHDAVVVNQCTNQRWQVTGDIRANREQFAVRIRKMLIDALS